MLGKCTYCVSSLWLQPRWTWKNRRLIALRLPARFPLRALVAIVLGALHAASFLRDATWPLELAVLAALFALVARSGDVPAAARVGFAFGLGWFLCGISWVYISLHVYGQMSWPLAGLATVLLCSALALYPTLACTLAAWIGRHEPGRIFLAIAPLWSLSELARGYFLTGFPWLATGYAHVGGPLAGFAPILGVYGITLLAAFIAAAIAALGGRVLAVGTLAWRASIAAVIGIPLLGLTLLPVQWSTPLGSPLSVRLLQGDVPQDVKFDPARFQTTVEKYLGLVEQKRGCRVFLGIFPKRWWHACTRTRPN